MKYILFEASVIANAIKCDNFKVSQLSSSKDDIWIDLEFIHTDYIESYSIDNNGYVYYSVRLKNRFFIINHKPISSDYRKWVEDFSRNKIYSELLHNLYEFIEICTEIVMTELKSAIINYSK